jgi:hypothetical protein
MRRGSVVLKNYDARGNGNGDNIAGLGCKGTARITDYNVLFQSAVRTLSLGTIRFEGDVDDRGMSPVALERLDVK